MPEFLSTPEGILTLFSTLFGSGGILSTIILAIVNGAKNRKYAATVATSQAKDSQILQLENDIQELKNVIGMLASMITQQVLSSLSLTSETKKNIVEIASRIEKFSSIKLDATVEKALEVMTTLNPQLINEEKRQEIEAAASKTQEVLDTVNEETSKLIETLEV